MLKRKLQQIKNVKQVIWADTMQTDQELCNDKKNRWRTMMMMKTILALYQQQAIQVANEEVIHSKQYKWRLHGSKTKASQRNC